MADSSIDAVRRVGSTPLGVMPYAVDPDAADRLWTLSERLTGSAIQWSRPRYRDCASTAPASAAVRPS